ncbi:helix-turn-helix domain-containing protein [Halorubellus sp. JP-L1]|uniref:helix-turn-helix domain-containing protein n=1 Tax=Halorubellus sp. JP-L1 TaxID=2715753 RepID=UPI0014076552|nr:helix-turn-helix domain-containing protein [Halorubellus sp. JP-L1]NHN42035.1 helix-turn-helix domain-containing protein [Halorubellus sp. JP-L1]
MKRVRITLSPSESYLPPVYRLLTREATYLSRVDIVNWNVAEPPVGFLLWVRGDHGQLEAALEAGENVREFELFPDGSDEAYVFLAAETATPARALFENFTRDDVLTVPPIECHDDGSSTFTLVGTDGAIQDAVDGVPDGVTVTVDAVGTGAVEGDDVVRSLSGKQREAVRAAVRVGYYEVPRAASVADVASELDCARSTASEHLQKAESRVFAALFGA